MAPRSFLSTPLLWAHNEALLPVISGRSHVLQICIGPLVTILFVMLEMLRRSAAEGKASELYQHLWKFISKAEARDKVGKIFQYGCRMMTGISTLAAEDSFLAPWRSVFPEVQTTLTWARRTHRWGKEMPHIPALEEAIRQGDFFESLQRAFILLYLIQDHMYWLMKVGILKFKEYSPIQWHRRNLKFVLPAYVINFCLHWKKIAHIKLKQKQQLSAREQEEATQAIYDNRKMMLRYTLTFFQIVHGSQTKILHDSYIGFFGMISSYIDASKQW